MKLKELGKNVAILLLSIVMAIAIIAVLYVSFWILIYTILFSIVVGLTYFIYKMLS